MSCASQSLASKYPLPQLERRPVWHIFEADFPDDPPFGTVLANIVPIVAARVLGHALIDAPNDTGRDALVCDITACNEDFELGGPAHLYVFGLIRVFYNSKGPTPAVTPALTPRLPLEAAAEHPHVIKPFSSDPATLRALVSSVVLS
ncbi:hypothetical protein BV20DRAFT_68585 [Pilatotrama ljubarskyi]|nr:hypothetical protein BV20DRAFT_68585 [Pilatotrama ljubarskyi]